MSTKKIGVVGYGKVGGCVTDFLKNQYEVEIYDPAYDEYSDKDAVNKCEGAVVCVPTPMAEDGVCDTTIVEETIEWLEVPHILIKSAVPPKTTSDLILEYDKKIAVSPEYLGEGGYHVPYWKGYPDPDDLKRHDHQIFGGPKEETKYWIDIFQRIMGPDAEYWQTDAITAETVKYMENCWIAAKVTFVNEFYEIAEKLGVDFKDLRELWLRDKRVSRMHTSVFPDSRGFGGGCLPKDVNAIIKRIQEEGYEPELLKEILRSNDRFRKKM